MDTQKLTDYVAKYLATSSDQPQSQTPPSTVDAGSKQVPDRPKHESTMDGESGAWSPACKNDLLNLMLVVLMLASMEVKTHETSRRV